MKDKLILFVHLLATIARLMGPGGAKTIVADSLLIKQQLLIINRSRRRAPHLTVLDRFLLGFWSLFLSPRHIQRAAVMIRPSTLLKFHRLLKQRKYRLLHSSVRRGKPELKGPSPELIQAIVECKRRNPRFGCPRIAQQINKAFGTDLDKDVVRRILAIHYQPEPGGSGPSWLTFLGHTKDSLWSIDLFRCESILLKSHWVLVERLIGTIRREFLDQTLFWNSSDLERKLADFRQYYNAHRIHTAHDSKTSLETAGESANQRADLSSFCWESHCRGLYQLPAAA
jgi:hypothetical protein